MRIRLPWIYIPRRKLLSDPPSSSEGGGSKSFISIVAATIGALGGFAAMFIGFGYITIASFLSRLKIYGLVEFPIQFYREAPISLIRNGIEVFSDNFIHAGIFSWIFLLISIGTLLLMIIKKIEYKWLKAIFSWLYLIGILAVIFLTLFLETFRKDMGLTVNKNVIIFYFVILPAFVSLFIFLSKNIEYFNIRNPLEGKFGIFLLSFIILFIAIPVSYGSHIFDLYLYEVTQADCSQMPSMLKEKDEYTIFYVMGHTQGREVFARLKTKPPFIVLVDRNLIQSISVRYEKPKMTLRKLFEEQIELDRQGEETIIKENMRNIENISPQDKAKWK